MKDRIAAAEKWLDSFEVEIPHCRQVRDLAVSLFDQLQPLHGLDADARDILDAAALLHDIGWTVSGSKHHKHSANLIRENADKLTGFSARQVELIAVVARYHRKSPPAMKHNAYAGLPAIDRNLVDHLAGILRIADGLDRPHDQAVKKVDCRVSEHAVTINIKVATNPDEHIAGSLRKCDVFESAFGLPVEFKVGA